MTKRSDPSKHKNTMNQHLSSTEMAQTSFNVITSNTIHHSSVNPLHHI